MIRAKARLDEQRGPQESDYQTVDISSLDMVRPRSVGIEHVGLEALRQVGLDAQLERMGFTKPQLAVAIGTIIARMTAPGSELFTYKWLRACLGIGDRCEKVEERDHFFVNRRPNSTAI